jgi:two-component system response regulator AtoC
MNDLKIIIVEDDKSALESLAELLSLDNFDVTPFSDPLKALNFIKNNNVDLVISDIKMPHLTGMELLEEIKNFNSSIDVILITAFGDISIAVNAIKKGASHYILKPINYEELKTQILNISEYRKLQNIISSDPNHYIEIIAESENMKKVINLSQKIAKSDSTVLLVGETGTGKEVISRFLHKNSFRANKPFLPVNCAALPKELLESELFGFEKGAFTGAIRSRRGKFILADKGTIFLDEISEMDYEIQSKLLRILEDGIVEKIGSEKSYKTDVRIIAATNKNLEHLVSEGKFRKDLYFRLNVFKINIPPLRNRKEDILPLSAIFIKNFSKKYNKKISGLSQSAINILLSYEFPGNIRELKHIIERAVILTSGNLIDSDDLTISKISVISEDKQNGIFIPFNTTLKEAENRIIMETLKANNFNKKKTAEILNISIRKIELRFKQLGVTLKELKEDNS